MSYLGAGVDPWPRMTSRDAITRRQWTADNLKNMLCNYVHRILIINVLGV